MSKPVNVTLSVSGAVDQFTYRVEQASAIAGLSVCSVANVRSILQSALHAICGYATRDTYRRGWGYEYLTSHGLTTFKADELLEFLITEVDQLIFEALKDRPYYNHWYVQLGQGRDVTTLYITRLGHDGCAFGYDGSGY